MCCLRSLAGRKRASQGPAIMSEEADGVKKIKTEPSREVWVQPPLLHSQRPIVSLPQDWTKIVTGLWQTEPRDFSREKAFNEVISLKGRRCCVCSMFDTPSPYCSLDRSALDRKVAALRAIAKAQPKITPLRVVVKRALVCLPDTLLTKCRLSRSHASSSDVIKRPHSTSGGSCDPDSDDEEGSELIVCRTCSIAVHKCESLLIVLIQMLSITTVACSIPHSMLRCGWY